MILQQIPISKIGTAFQVPNWRYQALAHPEKFGLQEYCSKRNINSGHTKRMVSRGIAPSEVYQYPDFFRQMEKQLTAEQCKQLRKIWDKRYFKRQPRKITFGSNATNQIQISWNIEKVQHINDATFKKLVLHQFFNQYDQSIGEAIKIYLSPNNSEVIRHIHYACYYGMSDKEMAKKWNKPMNVIKYLRLLFFDYSHFPTDRFVRLSLIRQLVTIGYLDDVDFHRFKRIFDLGKAGLDSLIGYENLSDADKLKVDSYINKSVIDNALDLRFSITTAQDAYAYGRMVGDIQRTHNSTVLAVEQCIMFRSQTEKLKRELGNSSSDESTVMDQSLLDLVRERSRFDNTPKYPSLMDIKEADAAANEEVK